MGPKVQKYKYFTKYVEHVFLMIDLFGRFLIQNWHVSYFLSISLLFVVTSVLESGVHCHFKLFFISNFYIFFLKMLPHKYYDVYRIMTTAPKYPLQKMWISALEILRFAVVYFSSEAVLQDVSKNNPNKNQIDGNIQVTLEQRGEYVNMLQKLSQQIIKTS